MDFYVPVQNFASIAIEFLNLRYAVKIITPEILSLIIYNRKIMRMR